MLTNQEKDDTMSLWMMQELLLMPKKKLLDLIIRHLRERKLEVTKAKKLARDFLQLLPINDQEDLLQKLEGLGRQYPEAQEIYIDELKEMSVQKRDRALTEMQSHIQQGKIEEAIKVARLAQQKGA
ncbi:hypothetical protein M1615_04750 [Patescibacteria group bacterium]|nr:hypothetical protein [Patescibacteria group bacterium]MCL5010128.1 hypothetical protein [Patescibacteria group bacterium]